jgi:hypothetical protein
MSGHGPPTGGQAPKQRGAGYVILTAVLRVARGRKDGIPLFGNSVQAFLTSLAPLIAFPLVGAGLMLLRGGGARPLADLLATACALLAPPVLSHQFARLWQREAAWPRFATAFNWCQWALPVVAMLILLLTGFLMEAGLSNRAAGIILVLGLAGYGLWLHWFLARHALSLSAGRSALLVLGVNVGTVAVVLGPRLVAGLTRT